MVAFGRWQKRFILTLALWSSLPTLQWCPLTWDQRVRALGEAAAACPMAREMGAACPMDRGPACENNGGARANEHGACANDEQGACTDDAQGACPSEPARSGQADYPPGKCAWCVRLPTEGVPVRGLDLPSFNAGPAVFGVVIAPRIPPPAAAERRAVETATACPALHSAHAPPQPRAPPSA